MDELDGSTFIRLLAAELDGSAFFRLLAAEVAAGDEDVKECTGGSTGTSFGGASLSECNPTVLSGSLRVPLFGLGVIPRESQTMLYSSVFSVLSSASQCQTYV